MHRHIDDGRSDTQPQEEQPAPSLGAGRPAWQRILHNYQRHSRETYNKEGMGVKLKELFAARRPGVLVGTCAIIIMLAIAMVYPGKLTAVASSVSDSVLKTFNLGEYSVVIQMKDTAPEEKVTLTPEQNEKLAKEGFVEIETADGTISIGTNPTEEAMRDTYASLAEAQKVAGFRVGCPSYLPEGYAFKEAKAYEGSNQYMDLYFNGPGKDIILMERLMNKDTAYVESTNAEVEAVDINGVRGVWEAPHTVTWEKDGVNYSLFCKGFNKEEALKVARSVK